MSDVNEVRLKGRLGWDPDAPRAVGRGKVVNVKVETQREHGEKTFTDRHVVVLWDALADKVDGAKKGDEIKIQGRLTTRSYEKNGAKVWVTEVVATHAEVGNEEPDDFGPPPAPRGNSGGGRSGGRQGGFGGGMGPGSRDDGPGPDDESIPFLHDNHGRDPFTE